MMLRSLALPLAIVVLTCTACKQQWSFAPPGYASLRPGANSTTRAAGNAKLPYGDAPDSGVVAAGGTSSVASAADPQAQTAPQASRETATQSPSDRPVQAALAAEAAPSAAVGGEAGRADLGEIPAIGPPIPVPLSDHDDDDETEIRPRLGQRIGIALQNTWTDHRHFYSWRTFGDLSLALGGAAILANTRLDQDFRNWFQQDVRSATTDDYARTFKQFGEGGLVIPIMAGVAIGGRLLDQWPLPDMLGEYGSRVTRAYAVGTPPLLLTQSLVGATRPNDDPSRYSYWHPFAAANGASGHAFIGSVPFITAAHMTDNWVLKGGLYFASTLTGWSRINDDKHYLSQVCLGWYLGYLAARAVNDTQNEDARYTLLPMVEPDGAGILFVLRH